MHLTVFTTFIYIFQTPSSYQCVRQLSTLITLCQCMHSDPYYSNCRFLTLIAMFFRINSSLNESTYVESGKSHYVYSSLDYSQVTTTYYSNKNSSSHSIPPCDSPSPPLFSKNLHIINHLNFSIYPRHIHVIMRYPFIKTPFGLG